VRCEFRVWCDDAHCACRWEEEGFTTYVPISPVNDDEEDQELFEEVARRWRDKSMHRRRLFYPEHREVAGICCTRGRREAMEDAVGSPSYRCAGCTHQ